MTFFEVVLLTVAAALYLTAFFLARKGLQRYAFFSLVAGLVLQLASVALRWAGSGHPPVFGTYEATLSASWFLLLFGAFSYRSVHGSFRLLVSTSVPMALLLLLYGLVFFNTERMPLTISELSLWVDFHALFSWLAFAPFTLAFCLSGFYLWSTRSGAAAPAPFLCGSESGGNTTAHESPQRQLDIIDELAFRYINFGFVNHTVMFALGSYYSSILFGTWWRWDPVFSISLMAWLLLGLTIHLRLFFNWNGRRAAWLFVLVFSVLNISYWGMVYLPTGSTFHIFDVDLKLRH